MMPRELLDVLIDFDPDPIRLPGESRGLSRTSWNRCRIGTSYIMWRCIEREEQCLSALRPSALHEFDVNTIGCWTKPKA